MQERSDLWISMWAAGAAVETIAVIAGTEYNSISNPVINRAAMQKAMSVGNCVSATLQLTVRTDDAIPAAAEVVIKSRLNDGAQQSEWLPQGTFYVSKRSRDKVNGTYTLTCYDAMRKANEVYITSSTDWPHSDEVVVTEIAEKIGVEIDPRSFDRGWTRATGQRQISVLVDVPSSTTAMIIVLQDIAAIHAGNFIITKEGKLRFISFYDGSSSLADGRIKVDAVTASVTADEAIYLSNVKMIDSDGTEIDMGAGFGHTLDIGKNPYASTEICGLLADWFLYSGYQPYTLTGAHYDIAAEIGDIVWSKQDVASVLWSETITLSMGPSATISAPAFETTDEYPLRDAKTVLLDEIQKTAKEAMEVAEEAAEDLKDTKSSVQDVIDTVDGKNSVYYTEVKPDGGNYTVNDIWFDTGTDNKMYQWSGSKWIERGFGNGAIQDINAEKITAGDIAAERIAGAFLAAAQAVVKDLSALKATIGGFKILDGAILATVSGTDSKENYSTKWGIGNFTVMYEDGMEYQGIHDGLLMESEFTRDFGNGSIDRELSVVLDTQVLQMSAKSITTYVDGNQEATYYGTFIMPEGGLSMSKSGSETDSNGQTTNTDAYYLTVLPDSIKLQETDWDSGVDKCVTKITPSLITTQDVALSGGSYSIPSLGAAISTINSNLAVSALNPTQLITMNSGYTVMYNSTMKIGRLLILELVIGASNAYSNTDSIVGVLNIGYRPAFSRNTFCALASSLWSANSTGYLYIGTDGQLLVRNFNGSTGNKYAKITVAYLVAL